MKNTKNVLLLVIGLIGLGLFCLMLFTMTPILNEESLKTKLEPAFEEFHRITRAKYPDKTIRDAMFAGIVAKKDQIVKDGTWPLVTCKVKFLIQNPGTTHRKDVKEIFCSWGIFWS